MTANGAATPKLLHAGFRQASVLTTCQPDLVTTITDVPGPLKTITEAELHRGIEQYAAFDGKENPHEGNYAYYPHQALTIKPKITETLCTALLHDTVEDTSPTPTA